MKTIDDLKERLKRIVKEEFIDSWLDTPNPAFDNKKPRDMIIENNIQPINKMIYEIESGIT